MVAYAKISPKMVNPGDIARGTQKKKKKDGEPRRYSWGNVEEEEEG